ncbi:MAG: DNA repair protein RecO [Minisyncoccia bacterium]
MTIKSSFAFVINKENSGESDRLYTFYTEEFGKIRLLAVGSQKIKAKLSGHLEIPSYVWIKFSLGRKNKLISALEIEPFLKLKENFWGLFVSFEILKFLDQFTLEGENDKKVWILLSQAFFYLKENIGKGWDKDLVHFLFLYFLAQFLKISGWAPYLKNCLICNEKANYFSFQQRGLVCRSHKDNDSIFLTPKEKESLRSLFEKNFEEFNGTILKEILQFQKKFLLIFQKFTFSLKLAIMD